MQRNRFPHQIGFRLGNAVFFKEFAGGVGAIDFKPLCLRVVTVDQAEVVKQRRDIEQFRSRISVAGEFP